MGVQLLFRELISLKMNGCQMLSVDGKIGAGRNYCAIFTNFHQYYVYHVRDISIQFYCGYKNESRPNAQCRWLDWGRGNYCAILNNFHKYCVYSVVLRQILQIPQIRSRHATKFFKRFFGLPQKMLISNYFLYKYNKAFKKFILPGYMVTRLTPY